MKAELLTIRIDKKTKLKLFELAEADSRTVSNYVLKLIDREISKSPELRASENNRTDKQNAILNELGIKI